MEGALRENETDSAPRRMEAGAMEPVPPPPPPVVLANEKNDEDARVRREALSGGGADGRGLLRGCGWECVGAWVCDREEGEVGGWEADDPSGRSGISVGGEADV